MLQANIFCQCQKSKLEKLRDLNPYYFGIGCQINIQPNHCPINLHNTYYKKKVCLPESFGRENFIFAKLAEYQNQLLGCTSQMAHLSKIREERIQQIC